MKGKYYLLVIILLILSTTIFFLEIKENIHKNNQFIKNLTNDQILYINENKININDLEPYFQYKKFDIFKYLLYKDAKEKLNLSYLESINYINNPNYYKPYSNPKQALFLNSSYVLVNKSYFLTKEYIPNNLVNIIDYNVDYIERDNEDISLTIETIEAYKTMYLDAKTQNFNFVIFSGYRSYNKQHYIYYNIYNQDNTISAKPGFSEHQTGLAIDISTRNDGLTINFENSKEYNWLINNAHKYGFILRFPRMKEDKTGYSFEPWHFRYVGTIANDIYKQELILEEYIFSNFEI